MNQLIYTVIIFIIAALLACSHAFGDDFEDTYLHLEATRMTHYIKKGGMKVPFKVHMVEVAPLPGDYVGACISFEGKPLRIEIVRKEWVKAGSIDRAYMLVHELMHCLLNLDHSEDPNDIMYWQMSSNLAKKKAILDALWQKTNTTPTKSF